MKIFIGAFRLFIVSIIFSAVISVPSFAQVDFKLGGGIGILSTASDFNGSTLEYYNGTRYGLTSGPTIHGKAKVGFSALNLTGEIDFSTLSNTGNSEPGQGKVDISQSIMSLKAGPEFHLSIPALPLTPYVGANIAVNRFSGETTFQGVSKVPSATYSVEAVTRLGAGFSIGAEVSIGPFMTLDFTTSYNFMNISGKEWRDVNPGINQRIDSYLSLNDSADPLFTAGDDKHFISSDRSISSVLFTVSLLFGL